MPTWTVLPVALAATMIVVGCAAGGGSDPAAPDTAGPPDVSTPAAGPTPTTPAPGPIPRSDSTAATPVRVRIPAIGVDGALIEIGLDAAGAMVPPERTDVAGWYGAGPVPGRRGPAVLAGHVDSRSGPGLFYDLRELAEGDRVEVDLDDGSSTVFVVTGTVQTAKAAFPTDAVYAPTPTPELRLVTCGGSFDAAVRSYRDNIIVSAVAEQPTEWTFR